MNDPTSNTARRVAALLTFAVGLWAGYFGIATALLHALAGALSRRSTPASTHWYFAALEAASILLLMLAAPLAAVVAPPKTTTRAVFAVLGGCVFVLGALQLAADASALGVLAWIVAVGAGAWWWLRGPPDGKALTRVYAGWSLTIGFVGSGMAHVEPVPLLVAVWMIVAGATLWSVWLLRTRSTTWRPAEHAS